MLPRLDEFEADLLWEQELAAHEVTCLVGALVRLGGGVPLVSGTVPGGTPQHHPSTV
jgi:hypothetical protein